MRKTITALLVSAALFSTAAHAVIQDQQWEDWYGNISAMEFEINTQNTAGEVLTLTCTSGKLAVAYSVPAEDYRVSSLTGLAEPGISINGTNYYLDETAFTALKSAGDKDVIKVTSTNSAISKKFSANGLNEALADTTWQDCINH
ncbi:hypothetical protein FZH48_22345 [Salmonella enterica]|uniref:Periplasmic protein n=1 Tax=Salmonella enterica TaxID=28901 RepID=A0A3K0PFV7_SALER|nr:hypothetical protein [Salmonella enterica]HAU3260718.1 hypothetical protein [Salmonella enterica subsp. diarizonae]EAO9176962.1 hypothetical protein [Salmonella enterica]EAW3568451.1 hypothetical protein [Salmonella enterica]EBO9593473.1 hypothetical protein [Salmonella enterica]